MRSKDRSADQLLYVGTYTENTPSEGIYLVRMDTGSGALSRVGVVSAGTNPSFLAIHPNRRTLYAVNEVADYKGKDSGAVSAFAIDRDSGSLRLLNTQPSEGAAPCYVSVDRTGRALLVANYMGGNVALLPIRRDGRLNGATHVARHVGFGPNPERQEKPHAHCIIPDPSNRYALAADLGVDHVLVYRLNPRGGSMQHLESGDVRLKAGAGPRHLAFHPRLPLLFVANELDNTVTALRFNPDVGSLSVVGTWSTLPEGWTRASFVADIHVAPSGKFLYVSNRGHNSIAVFSVADTGDLALAQVIATEGNWPRNFALDPTGRWLLVANQGSSAITVFARDDASGQLTLTPNRLEVPSPVCLLFGR